MLTFRTSDGTKWGAGKGGDLVPSEVDLNFWELLSRLTELESEPAAVGIDHFTTNAANATITVFLTDGTQRGPYALPVAQFRFLGEWEPDTVYPGGVFITVGEDTYIINIAHTSDDTFDPGALSGGNLIYGGPIPFPKDRTYDIGFFYPGTPGAGLPFDGTGTMFARAFSRDVYLPAGLAASVALLKEPAALDLEFPIMKGTTEIGSVLFAAGDTEGTFALAVNVQFNAGDWLRVLPFPITSDPPSEAPLDATAFDLSVNFAAVKGTP